MSMVVTDAREIAVKLTKARADWLISLPQSFAYWDWSERFGRRVVDYCVNQGLASWEITSDEVGCIAHHTLTPLGLEVRAALAQETQP
jgi:hypothetical protein